MQWKPSTDYARDPEFNAARAKQNVSSRTAHHMRGIGMERSAWTTVSQIVLDETGGCRLPCISYMAGSFAMYFTQAKICFICLDGALYLEPDRYFVQMWLHVTRQLWT